MSVKCGPADPCAGDARCHAAVLLSEAEPGGKRGHHEDRRDLRACGAMEEVGMGSASDGTPGGPAVPLPGDGRVPLSSAQQALWLADQAVSGGAQYHLGWIIQLDGPLDVAALRAALTELAGRHELLRASVPEPGGDPVLAIAPAAGITLSVTDVAEPEAGALARAVVVRPFAPAGPLWRAELHRVAPDRHRLIFVLHHLVADAATIAVLFAELAAAYRAWHEGHPPQLPPAVPYRQFLDRER